MFCYAKITCVNSIQYATETLKQSAASSFYIDVSLCYYLFYSYIYIYICIYTYVRVHTRTPTHTHTHIINWPQEVLYRNSLINKNVCKYHYSINILFMFAIIAALSFAVKAWKPHVHHWISFWSPVLSCGYQYHWRFYWYPYQEMICTISHAGRLCKLQSSPPSGILMAGQFGLVCCIMQSFFPPQVIPTMHIIFVNGFLAMVYKSTWDTSLSGLCFFLFFTLLVNQRNICSIIQWYTTMRWYFSLQVNVNYKSIIKFKLITTPAIF